MRIETSNGNKLVTGKLSVLIFFEAKQANWNVLHNRTEFGETEYHQL